MAKAKLKLDRDKVPQKLQDYPKIEQWLQIVGISEDAVQVSTTCPLASWMHNWQPIADSGTWYVNVHRHEHSQ